MTEKVGDIALIGLAVMGQNLILNMADHGFTVVAFNRTVEKVHTFVEGPAKGKSVVGATSLQDMVDKLKSPRIVMLLVKAGPAVDDFIEQLIPLLECGDIIIDGGNSEYLDTERRCGYLGPKGILFVGSGVSGGEEGARHGPSLMPGGHKEAWPHVAPIFQAVAARADGQPCCDWVGDRGAGHFVKTVHNGIEYADMQLICEIYNLMMVIGMDQEEMASVFEEWNKGELDSYLIEITKDILRYKDSQGEYLLPKILDSAGQKGTGKWSVIAGLQYGTPVTLIGEAVFSRCLSALTAERREASAILPGPPIKPFAGDRKVFVNQMKDALYASKIVSYAQGFMLLRSAAEEHSWELDYGSIALMWRGGCIIRSAFLGDIRTAFSNGSPRSLLVTPFFSNALARCQIAWREVVARAALLGAPAPALSAALAFYDGYRAARLPANLLQAHRDYFGAHTYQLVDSPGTPHHTDWTGRGGDVTASTYHH